jgi:hypothetical protein
LLLGLDFVVKEKLEKFLTEARIVIGHGQLCERELEHVMPSFYQQPVINPQAQKRLDLIQLLEDLGATMHALESVGLVSFLATAKAARCRLLAHSLFPNS